MRFFIPYWAISMALFGAFANASSDHFDTKKVKTGILPAGGFYTVYRVDCREEVTASIASLNGKRRWCSLQDGAMNCFSSRQRASLSACMREGVAVVENTLDMAEPYQ